MKYDADVAIVGYGPSGVVAANLLGQYGIKCIVLEKDKDIYARARAVTVNDWTMRCFQAMGLDEELAKTMDEMAGLRWVTYDGNEILRLTFPDSIMGRHPSTYSIYQPAMEKILRDGVDRYKDNVEIRYETVFSDLQEQDAGVEVRYKNLKTDQDESINVQYVLGCDGGSSLVREKLGIKLVGDTVNTRWVVIDARVKRWWKNRNLLTFWSDKKFPVVDIALALGNHRWEIPLDETQSLDDFQTHEQLWPILNELGVTDKEVEIHQHAFYRHHVRHAEKWSKGRTYLLGDAAHMMPPWAGSGMQSGIRDAFNLCWKLKRVLNGNVSADILSSYEVERAPDVAFYTDVSVKLGQIIKQELSQEELSHIVPMLERERPMFRVPELNEGWLLQKAEQNAAIGKILPQPMVTNSQGKLAYLDDLLEDNFVAIGNGKDPRQIMSAEEQQSWEKLNLKYYTLMNVDSDGKGYDDLIDINGSLIEWMNQHNADIIIVRPDKFIMAANHNLALRA